MRYRKLDANEKDKELVIELQDHVTEPMPDEPEDSFDVYWNDYMKSHQITEEQKPSSRTLDRTWESRYGPVKKDDEEFNKWKEWKEKYRWVERAMVYDFIQARIPSVSEEN